MHKKFLLGRAFIALATGGCFRAGNSTPRHQFTSDEIANIEALTQSEDIGATITCSSGNQGRCFIADTSRIYICGEYMYNPCTYIGLQQFSCRIPCY